MKLHVINSLTTKECFSLTSRYLEVVSIYDSPNDVSDNGLFQLTRETSCLFATLTSYSQLQFDRSQKNSVLITVALKDKKSFHNNMKGNLHFKQS